MTKTAKAKTISCHSFWFHLHCHSLFLGSLPLIRMTKRTKVLFVFEFFFCYEFSKITSDNQAKENYFLLCALFGFAFLVTRFIDLNAKKGKALSLFVLLFTFFLFRPFCFRFIDLIHQSWIKPKTANDKKRKNKENFVTLFCISLIVTHFDSNAKKDEANVSLCVIRFFLIRPLCFQSLDQSWTKPKRVNNKMSGCQMTMKPKLKTSNDKKGENKEKILFVFAMTIKDYITKIYWQKWRKQKLLPRFRSFWFHLHCHSLLLIRMPKRAKQMTKVSLYVIRFFWYTKVELSQRVQTKWLRAKDKIGGRQWSRNWKRRMTKKARAKRPFSLFTFFFCCHLGANKKATGKNGENTN